VDGNVFAVVAAAGVVQSSAPEEEIVCFRHEKPPKVPEAGWVMQEAR
jgi:hypothetical protein